MTDELAAPFAAAGSVPTKLIADPNAIPNIVRTGGLKRELSLFESIARPFVG
jgi:hypothetical protein